MCMQCGVIWIESHMPPFKIVVHTSLVQFHGMLQKKIIDEILQHLSKSVETISMHLENKNIWIFMVSL